MLGYPSKTSGCCPHFSMSLSSKYQIKHLGPFILALELLLNPYSLLPLHRGPITPGLPHSDLFQFYLINFICLTLSDLLQFYLNRQLSAYKYLKLLH